MLLSPFETPVFVGSLPDESLRREIARRLIEESEQTASAGVSIIGGWHGPPDLQNRPDACWRELAHVVGVTVREVIATVAEARDIAVPADVSLVHHGWGVVLHAGGYSAVHDHREAHWSSVFYADPGDLVPGGQPDSGALTLVDPRPGTNPGGPVDLFPRHCTIIPEAGTVVVIPGWVAHFVHPYAGLRPRVSAAFNTIVRACA